MRARRRANGLVKPRGGRRGEVRLKMGAVAACEPRGAAAARSRDVLERVVPNTHQAPQECRDSRCPSIAGTARGKRQWPSVGNRCTVRHQWRDRRQVHRRVWAQAAASARSAGLCAEVGLSRGGGARDLRVVALRRVREEKEVLRLVQRAVAERRPPDRRAVAAVPPQRPQRRARRRAAVAARPQQTQPRARAACWARAEKHRRTGDVRSHRRQCDRRAGRRRGGSPRRAVRAATRPTACDCAVVALPSPSPAVGGDRTREFVAAEPPLRTRVAAEERAVVDVMRAVTHSRSRPAGLGAGVRDRQLQAPFRLRAQRRRHQGSRLRLPPTNRCRGCMARGRMCIGGTLRMH